MRSEASVNIDGLVQEKRNYIANTLELRLSCTTPSIWYSFHHGKWGRSLANGVVVLAVDHHIYSSLQNTMHIQGTQYYSGQQNTKVHYGP